jgi:3-phenylpropionate/trans-cinnamate dioxygenase ferredoxin subunit
MGFLPIAKINEIPESGAKYFNLSGRDILIIKYGKNYYAIDRFCSHMGGDLSKGSIEKNIIICPRHGSRFDIKSGESIAGPKLGFIKLKTKSIKAYELKIEDEQILIRIDNIN